MSGSGERGRFTERQKGAYLVITVREVETGDVHASVEHLDEHLSVPAGGSERADDLGLALAELDVLEDVLELDAA